MLSNKKQLFDFIKLFVERLRFRFDSGPVPSIDSLEDFVVTRAAFIAQRSLYGYVKTRMGTRYPDMFKDDNIIHSLNIAKMYVYAACLSDLAIHAVAKALADAAATDAQRRGYADRFFRTGLERNSEAMVAEFKADDVLAEHRRRLAFTDWDTAAGPDNFTASPSAVVRWAPIAEHLKARDAEYVDNSVRYAWINIRRALDKRMDASAIQGTLGGSPPVEDIPPEEVARTGENG